MSWVLRVVDLLPAAVLKCSKSRIIWLVGLLYHRSLSVCFCIRAFKITDELEVQNNYKVKP